MEIIHIVLGKANPDRMNGVNKVVYNLAAKQAEYGHEIWLWGITKSNEINFGQRKFRTQLFLKNKNPFSVPKTLKKEIEKTNDEVVFHLHGGWIPVFYSISRFLKKKNKRFVITPHGAYNSVAMKKNHFIKKIYFHFFERGLLRKAYKIHSIGKSEIEGINKTYSSDKNVLIPYGFDFVIRKRAKKIPEKNIVFGFVGRLDIYTKGLDVLVEAFSEFTQKVPDAMLWMVGNSKKKKELERLVKNKNLESKVLFLGSRFGKEKDFLLSEMDVFMHPSRNEGLPISIIEAASFGKPCIVSNYTNIGEEIEKHEAGISVKEFSPTHFAEAMLCIYKKWHEQKGFEEMKKNAITMVKKEYNWQNCINQLNEKLYE